MDLLSKLVPVLAEMIAVWDVFASPRGGNCYFQAHHDSEETRAQMGQALGIINEGFETLKTLQQRLFSLKGRCREVAENVGSSEEGFKTLFINNWQLNVRMIIESNKTSHQIRASTSHTALILSVSQNVLLTNLKLILPS